MRRSRDKSFRPPFSKGGGGLEAEPPRSYLVQDFFGGLEPFLDKKGSENLKPLQYTTGCDIMNSDFN
jgi:hypothetical protein